MTAQDFRIVIVSIFEGGFQPLLLGTAAAHLCNAGFEPRLLDTYVDGLDETLLIDADFVGISVPLFDALSAGVEVARKTRKLSPQAHISFFGQYATLNSEHLARHYADSVIRGEWDIPLITLIHNLADGRQITSVPGVQTADRVAPAFFSRNDLYLPPRRDLLPPLQKYVYASWTNPEAKSQRIVGNVEITRGCHHRCLYCSVYASYEGRVFPIPEPVIFADVANLVEMGSTHITFVDADFLNARRYALKVVRRLHEHFPFLTFDITTRADHLIEAPKVIEEFVELGCNLVTSALEFPDDRILRYYDKHVTVAQIEEAIGLCQRLGLKLNPTFILFNPWAGFEELSRFQDFINRNQLEDVIDPIQYETRLLLYKGSPLLGTAQIEGIALEEREFHYDWKHPDPQMDELYFQSITPAKEGIFKRCCIKC